ncbi:hypothetical protein KY348_02375 [Candidatus Woesearchaeota archaeon]|nr:hypothetical protein [Candidatus Woesearchaeota archaeon]
MHKKTLIIGLMVIAALILLTSCKPKPEQETNPLFNESLNEQIEELTRVEEEPGEFEEFMFEYEPRNESKYEIAEDDVFSVKDFTSTEISFFGLMLGDSYEDVLERLGIPDVMFIPKDESFRNMEYRNKIGIGSVYSGIIFHLENDTVTRITVKSAFNKYLHGNTSIGTDKEVIYALLDIPDYQSFIVNLRVFHYVEKGVEVYFKNRYIDRISFIFPKEFKGVEYVSKEKLVSDGIIVNITEPVLVE